MIDIRRAVADGQHKSYIVFSTSELMENLLSAVILIMRTKFKFKFLKKKILKPRFVRATWCHGTLCICFYGYARLSAEHSRLIYQRRCACASSQVPGRDCECILSSIIIITMLLLFFFITLVLPPLALTSKPPTSTSTTPQPCKWVPSKKISTT